MFYYRGLKQHLTPILAGLLESNEKKKWSFNTLFKEVEITNSACYSNFEMHTFKKLVICP
jgi:hypothetical protein